MTVCASLSDFCISLYLGSIAASSEIRAITSLTSPSFMPSEAAIAPYSKPCVLFSFAISFSVSVRVGSMPLKGLFPALTRLISSWMAAVSVRPATERMV